MTSYPRTLNMNEISPQLAALVRGLAGRMLGGASPQHQALREQLAAARLSRVDLTGAGLYAHFEHSPDVPRATPPDMIGGEVSLEVRGLDAPAGSLLKVTGGLLDFVEVYTFGNNGWPDEPEVVAFGEPVLLQIPASAT